MHHRKSCQKANWAYQIKCKQYENMLEGNWTCQHNPGVAQWKSHSVLMKWGVGPPQAPMRFLRGNVLSNSPFPPQGLVWGTISHVRKALSNLRLGWGPLPMCLMCSSISQLRWGITSMSLIRCSTKTIDNLRRGRWRWRQKNFPRASKSHPLRTQAQHIP